MKETVLILGADGYIGWNLMMYLGRKNQGLVVGIDNYSRRKLVNKVKGDSLIPIASMKTRIEAYKEVFKKNNLRFFAFDITNSHLLRKAIKKIRPTIIINLAQMPSAPYSMKNLGYAAWTIKNNVIGNLNLLWIMREICPKAHLIKMGTMGEYGTPNVDIPKGFFELKYKGRKDWVPFPRQAGSFYHWAKVTESQHTNFACKIWGLRATDMMQGVVYGVTTEESQKDSRLAGRFDYDGVFGTAINRFVVQSMCGIPMTPFGKGGQIRGFLNIKDSLKCFELYINNPPKEGEYRVFNQLVEQHRTVTQLADMVKQIGKKKGYNSSIKKIKNPRIENEKHYYNAETTKLTKLGLIASDFRKEIEKMFDDLKPYIHRVNKESIIPKITWK